MCCVPLNTIDNIATELNFAYLSQKQEYPPKQFAIATIEAITNAFIGRLNCCKTVQYIDGATRAMCNEKEMVHFDHIDNRLLIGRVPDFRSRLEFDENHNIEGLCVENELKAPLQFLIEGLKEQNGKIQCDRAGLYNLTSKAYVSTLKCDRDHLFDTFKQYLPKSVSPVQTTSTPSTGSPSAVGSPASAATPTPGSPSAVGSPASAATPTPGSPSAVGSTAQTSGQSSNGAQGNAVPQNSPFAWLGGAAVLGVGCIYVGYKARQAQIQKNSESTAPISSERPQSRPRSA